MKMPINLLFKVVFKLFFSKLINEDLLYLKTFIEDIYIYSNFLN